MHALKGKKLSTEGAHGQHRQSSNKLYDYKGENLNKTLTLS
jgi:hypothetical protein